MPRIRTIIPGVDQKLLIKDAARMLPDPTRRLLLRGGLSLGALAVLGGCDIVDSDAAEGVLKKISTFNDRVQAMLFNPNKLAPTYPDAMITRPFPFNAFYGEDEVREVAEAGYQLEVTGLVADKRSWTLADLRAMPQQDRNDGSRSVSPEIQTAGGPVDARHGTARSRHRARARQTSSTRLR